MENSQNTQEEILQNEVTKYNVLQERGKFTANGYTFEVSAIYFNETEEYLADVPLSNYLESEKDVDDSTLTKAMGSLFFINNEEQVKASLGKLNKLKLWLVKHTNKKYKYYSNNPSAIGLVKWLEKKVKYNNKPIRFYDLERKYKLTKLEIAELFRYMHDLSFF